MIYIDNQSRTPVYEQIIKQIETYVLSGILTSGEQLASVRALSIALNVNPNTVQRAYTELDRKGVIYTISGVGAFIKEDALDLLRKERKAKLVQLEPLIKELAISQVPIEDIISLIKRVYEGERT